MLKGVFIFMKSAIIFANGRMEKPPDILSILQTSDLLIAADGGTHNCEALGIKPDVIIGDLDSMNPDDVTSYRDAGVEVINYPAHKDESDLELSLEYSLVHDFTEIVIIGGLGERWDMTMMNIVLMAHPKFSGLNIRLLDGTQELLLLKPGKNVELAGKPGDTLSLIALAGEASGILTHGLEYPLNNETLQFGESRGVSNVFTAARARIAFSQGLILCIINRVEGK
jgi:thiamine pyrophosphokinase